jgi:GT2 family glycosyltransferase
MLGALEPWKRPDLALEAVALAAHDLPRIRLTVAGAPLAASGERLVPRLRERAERPDLAGRVELTGALSDVRPALRRAWCLLHCAEREPFGTVVLQALASGRPVVAPDAGSPAEVVDESCGRLYPPGDARAAAAALVELLSSPELARSLGAGGRARADGFDAGAARDRFAAAALQALPGGDARRSDAGAGAALITVTHNSSAELPRLLLSARRHLPRAKLIVVDSGSEDGSADAARAAAPDAAVIELSENVGFGRASNAGVAVAGELVSVLVNPDVELVDDSLAALAAELLEAGAPERMLAPLALSRDGARQDTAQLDPRSPLLWLRALAPPVALPGPLRRAIDPWRAQRRRRVGWAVGCCLIARTETLRRLGPFDERIFLFGEDLDLGMRAAEQGIETWFCPDARVLHLDSHAVDRAFGGEPFEALARQRRAVIGERWGPRAAWRDHWTMLLTYANRIAIKTLLARPSARERKQLAAEWRARRALARL